MDLRKPNHRPAPRRPALTGLLALLAFAFAAPSAEAARFDAARVIDDARAQCDFGPRIPGTPAHEATRNWIRERMERLGLEVREQPFVADLALTGEQAEAWNLWGTPPGMSLEGAADEGIILLSAHWDTRPWADEEPWGRARTPFLGANDGAASVAFVLEIVRVLRDGPLADRVAVVFFDAEDSGVVGDADSWGLGARYAVAHPPDWLERLRLGINIDMIASPGVKLRREGWSRQSAPDALNRLWRIGRDMAPGVFLDEDRPGVIDDHLPFVEAGFRYINLIGLPNPHWHRLSDTPDNLDPLSIRNVGSVLLEFLGQELAEPQPPRGATSGQTPN
jgi:glutaminyl-peptide cyclotransferase